MRIEVKLTIPDTAFALLCYFHVQGRIQKLTSKGVQSFKKVSMYMKLRQNFTKFTYESEFQTGGGGNDNK